MQMGEEKEEQYEKHIPGELERLREELMDADEITEEIKGYGEKPKENADQNRHTKDNCGEKRKMTQQKTAPQKESKHNHNRIGKKQ